MRALVLLSALVAMPATAQVAGVAYPPPANTAAIADQAASAQARADAAMTAANAAQAKADAAQAALPQPSNVVGQGEMVGGAPGSAMTYKRGDWIPPRRSRTGSCVLPTSGVCTVPWSSAFGVGEVPVMLGDPVATNASALQPISCNITGAPTTTGVPVKCWQAQPTVLGASLLAIANLAINPFGTGTLAGVVVTTAAIPGSQ